MFTGFIGIMTFFVASDAGPIAFIIGIIIGAILHVTLVFGYTLFGPDKYDTSYTAEGPVVEIEQINRPGETTGPYEVSFELDDGDIATIALKRDHIENIDVDVGDTLRLYTKPRIEAELAPYIPLDDIRYKGNGQLYADVWGADYIRTATFVNIELEVDHQP